MLAVLAFAAGLYPAVYYPQLLYTLGVVTPFKMILGVLATGIVLEAIRRLLGWSLVIIVAVFILYARWGYLIPGTLGARELSWDRLFNYMYLGADALFGLPFKVAATTVLCFILFGQFLFGTGGGNFLVNIAQAIMGRYRGGPAKVAIVASSFFGMISGSAVANVVSTGVVTIPLIKKAGYRPEFAGAVETVASTGGTICPPVMGAAAFVIAGFLGMPYPQVVIL